MPAGCLGLRAQGAQRCTSSSRCVGPPAPAPLEPFGRQLRRRAVCARALAQTRAHARARCRHPPRLAHRALRAGLLSRAPSPTLPLGGPLQYNNDAIEESEGLASGDIEVSGPARRAR